MAIKTERRIMLKTADENSTLDGYIFNDEAHAREWLSQEFVTDEAYSVAIVSARRRKCCGRLYAIEVLRPMKVSEFLTSGRGHEFGGMNTGRLFNGLDF